MDVVEFAERFMNVELADWQKKHLQALYEMGTDAKVYICMPKNASRKLAYIRINNSRELISIGAQTDCK